MLASHRQEGDQENVLGEIRMHLLHLFSSHKLWPRQLQGLSFAAFFFFPKAILSYLMLKFCHTALNTEALEWEISWKFVCVSSYAWHFHTDKIQLNIDFLVKFGLGVWSMSIDCELLSFFSFRARTSLTEIEKKKKGKNSCLKCCH